MKKYHEAKTCLWCKQLLLSNDGFFCDTSQKLFLSFDDLELDDLRIALSEANHCSSFSAVSVKTGEEYLGLDGTNFDVFVDMFGKYIENNCVKFSINFTERDL